MVIFGNLIIVTTRGDECNPVHQRRTDGSARLPNRKMRQSNPNNNIRQ